MNTPNQLTLVLILIFTGLLVSSCDEQRNRFTVDYSLAEDHKYDIAKADSTIIKESGLEIYIIEEGSGTFEVEVKGPYRFYYTGRRWSSGEIFDSSYRNGNTSPTTFNGLTSLVEGFREGVKGMKEGGKRVLIIPPELGYGSSPTSSLRNDTLRFDIELDEIVF